MRCSRRGLQSPTKAMYSKCLPSGVTKSETGDTVVFLELTGFSKARQTPHCGQMTEVHAEDDTLTARI